MTAHVPRRVLVTSGPTRAYFDRIRYIANSSSGALGDAVVQALIDGGMPVIHIAGEGATGLQRENSDKLEIIRISTIEELIIAINHLKEKNNIGAVVHAMAVLDYMPKKTMSGKKKSGDEIWDIRLVQTPKVIGMFRYLFPEAFLVGFKLEAGVDETTLISSARSLILKNHLNLAVANDLDRITGERHEALFIEPDGTVKARTTSKKEIAVTLANLIGEYIG